MSRYTIGVDIGTTGTKTVLLDTTDKIVATASRETALHSPAPDSPRPTPRSGTAT